MEGALLNDLSLVQDINPVCVGNRLYLVSNHQNKRHFKFVYCLLNFMLICPVESRSCFVQYQYLWRFNKCPCNSYPLLLTSTQLAILGVDTYVLDEVPCFSCLQGLDDLDVCPILGKQCFPYCFSDEYGFLPNIANGFSQTMQSDLWQRQIIEVDCS